MGFDGIPGARGIPGRDGERVGDSFFPWKRFSYQHIN